MNKNNILEQSEFEEPIIQVIVFSEEEITADSFSCFLLSNTNAD